MSDLRNPFYIRTTEHIDSDDSFLRLFAPSVLDLLPKNNLWDKPQIFRSAPGGGKTTLFRVFTPTVLVKLFEARNGLHNELYTRLSDLDVFGDYGPQLLAVMIPCSRNYATLEDLVYPELNKLRIFYSLLNSRIILGALRGALTLRRLEYPDDLDRLKIKLPPHIEVPQFIPLPGTGKELYDWARQLEKEVLETLDSFSSPSHSNIQGHDSLYALSIIRPDSIYCDDILVATKTLVLLDDVQKLSLSQRQTLLRTISETRPYNGLWIAERLEALSPGELLNEGAIEGREWGEPVNLEVFWNSSSLKFKNAILEIAERRTRSARDFRGSTFTTSLQDTLDGEEWEKTYQAAITTISERVNKYQIPVRKFEDLIAQNELSTGTFHDRAIAWRSLEVLFKSESDKPQQMRLFNTDFDEFALADSLPVKGREVSSQVRAAAELYLAQEFKIPYYFGSNRLATLSSSNIDQFLSLAGALFEEIISTSLVRKQQTNLTPKRQETILKRVSQKRWDEIPRRVSYGNEVQKLLIAIQQFCRWHWEQGKASYGGGGGITGIALNHADLKSLLDPLVIQKNPSYKTLVLVLSACVSHNLLKEFPNRKQGAKGKKTFTIFYLNRLLCMQFDLPLQYGGWKEKSPRELCKWLEHGYIPPN